jgi:hypothetical protein
MTLEDEFIGIVAEKGGQQDAERKNGDPEMSSGVSGLQ